MRRLLRSLVRSSAPVVAVALTEACAAISRPPTTIPALQAERVTSRAAELVTTDTVIARLVRRVQRRGDRTIDILMLSGGGQHGAYGAGFLRGWGTRPEGKMPTFDLVTGVSAGGLQSPLAFLGTPSSLDTLSMLFREAVERTKPSIDWLFWLRKTGGVVSTGKLERTIGQVFDSTMIRRLQRELANDRQLVIGTTDGDLGIARTWDLRHVLDQPQGDARARLLMKATSAIPGIFPPVVIDGHVHFDGGIVSNVMPVLDLDAFRRLGERLRAAGVQEPVTVRLWLVMNLFAEVPTKVLNPASRKAMNYRALELLFFSQQATMFARFENLVRAASQTAPGLTIELRGTAIDGALIHEPGAGELFDKAWMLRMETYGFDRARGTDLWDVVVEGAKR
ncbi:MAG: patatin-like phospholipase family protein [Cytophagaceae bacterium]|nr:patatin-like phospholipase family protein [Gemmatimonadaceae bacterium]